MSRTFSVLKEQEKYVQDLEHDLKASLNWYTGVNFDQFNSYIRSGYNLTTIQREHLENIDKAFNNVPVLEDALTVYKGKSSETVYSDKSFISTSTSIMGASRFSGRSCCILQITVSPGSRVLPLRTISEIPDEEEVLLDRNGHLVVTGSTVDRTNFSNMKIIFVTYSPYESKVVHDEKETMTTVQILDRKMIVNRVINFFIQDIDSDDSDDEIPDENDIRYMFEKFSGEKITDKELEHVKSILNLK